MKPVSFRHWITALSAALVAHAGLVALLYEPSLPPVGARATGLSGIEISLGPAGGAPGAASMETASTETADDSRRTDEAEPKRKSKPEDMVEAMPDAKGTAKSTPPPKQEAIAKTRPAVPVPAPTHEAKPESTPDTKPEPKAEAKTQPQPKQKSVAETTPVAPSPTHRSELKDETLTESKPGPVAQARVVNPESAPQKQSAPQGVNGISGSKDRPESGDGDTGAGGGVPGLERDYFAQLSAWLERHKLYPSRAQRRGQEGTVYLRFVVDRKGKVLSYQIERTSGYALLDREVEKMIRRAAPMPAMPNELAQSRLELVVPVSFYMR